MKSEAISPDDYLNSLPPQRKEALSELRNIILKNLPRGFAEVMAYGMIAYVVPHSLYPSGYHTSPAQPLPFINLASQKNFIALYHMGLYSDKKLPSWFNAEYAKHSRQKLDIGKSCIRFKKPQGIPFALMGELAAKITVEEWIRMYENGKQ